ncbi:DUF6881 domain-containing protein [Tahibacter soli]|uniref:DUF6881 domain-containing protein n=1 Tax=Tahibacter soli TaxID=2983605 RepID=A0A9X4BIR9_9GAMM|nr:hypothetical protein [Tahibacter soli]MDC8012507.1 hypothetical protein [Tahibacter soli]
MNYLKVRWVHQRQSDPVLLLSELDDDRYELRKVEVFPDGRMGFSGLVRSSGGTVLGEKPVPVATEIAADPQFIVEQSDSLAFEDAWRAALSGACWKP